MVEREKIELMNCLEARPSREDDIKLIKDLKIEIYERQNYIQGVQVRFKDTQEVIRQLELEVENQRRNFDIFGQSSKEKQQTFQSFQQVQRAAIQLKSVFEQMMQEKLEKQPDQRVQFQNK